MRRLTALMQAAIRENDEVPSQRAEVGGQKSEVGGTEKGEGDRRQGADTRMVSGLRRSRAWGVATAQSERGIAGKAIGVLRKGRKDQKTNGRSIALRLAVHENVTAPGLFDRLG